MGTLIGIPRSSFLGEPLFLTGFLGSRSRGHLYSARNRRFLVRTCCITLIADTLRLIAGVLTSTGCSGVAMALLVAYHCVGVQVCCSKQNQTKPNGCAAFEKNSGEITKMRRNWPFFKDSDWLILVFVHSAKPTAELENQAMSPSLSSPGLSYDTKFVHIGWELRSSLVGDTILGV